MTTAVSGNFCAETALELISRCGVAQAERANPIATSGQNRRRTGREFLQLIIIRRERTTGTDDL